MYHSGIPSPLPPLTSTTHTHSHKCIVKLTNYWAIGQTLGLVVYIGCAEALKVACVTL